MPFTFYVLIVLSPKGMKQLSRLQIFNELSYVNGTGGELADRAVGGISVRTEDIRIMLANGDEGGRGLLVTFIKSLNLYRIG